MTSSLHSGQAIAGLERTKKKKERSQRETQRRSPQNRNLSREEKPTGRLPALEAARDDPGGGEKEFLFRPSLIVPSFPGGTSEPTSGSRVSPALILRSTSGRCSAVNSLTSRCLPLQVFCDPPPLHSVFAFGFSLGPCFSSLRVEGPLPSLSRRPYAH